MEAPIYGLLVAVNDLLHNNLNFTRASISWCDLWEDRRMNDVAVNFFTSLLCKTNRLHVAVRLFSNKSQKTSKCGKNISDTLA